MSARAQTERRVHGARGVVIGGRTARARAVARAVVVGVTAVAAGSLAAPAAAQDGPLAIRGGTVLTVTQGTIEGGTVLVRDGKIAAVGTDVRIPADATVIDATGKFVMPGIIDAHSHIATDAVNEGSISVSSMVNIVDVLDPADINIYRELAGGVTVAQVLHGSANPIGGQSVVIKLRWGSDARGLIFRAAPPTIKFALGENVKRSNFPAPPGTERRYPATRMGVMDVIREAFTEAKAYQAKWREYERRRKAGERDLVPPRRDLKLDPLVEVLEGKRMVHAHSYRADEILQLLRVAEELGFKITAFQHVLEGYKVADEIAAHGAGASTFSDWWAYKVEAYDAIPYNAALMTQRGVVVSVNSDSPEEARHLNQEAAKTMKWGGLTADQALRLITINPAIQLKVDDHVGSIEAGKDADLVIFEHHPLSAYAKALTTIIDGKIYFDVEKDRERQRRIAEEKEMLKKKLGESSEGGAKEAGAETVAGQTPPPTAGRAGGGSR
ncbi:MAG: amidohydrolase [Gemmatimonadota bacterium]